MRCESYNANKFNIMFHVCSLVVMSESPQKLSCSENASKLATRNQTRSLRNYSKDLGDALHSSKINVGNCQNHPTRPYTGNKWKTYQNRTLPKKEFVGGKWREYGRNNGKYDRLGKSLQERARLNTILWYFPRGKIILGVLEIPCTPQKPKWAAARTIQLAQKLEKNWKTYQNRTLPKKKFFGGKWRKYGRKREKHERLEKPL